MKPVIGIISRYTQGADACFGTSCAYVRAVEQAGGLALQLPVTETTDAAVLEQWFSLCGGFLLPGGEDVAPAYYGQSPIAQVTHTNRRRDAVELALCRAAAQHGVPLLGICRGAQVMNVAFGGTLWQDLPAQCRTAICHVQSMQIPDELFHSLVLVPGSALESVMGAQRQECNTLHHQAVRDVAPGFSAAAHAPDGVVEAIENEAGTMLGVQWHPEYLAARYPAHAALFRWLVQRASRA